MLATWTPDCRCDIIAAMNNAHGTFDVKLAPQTPYDSSEGAVGRMTIDKEFQGDLIASSKGEMLAIMSSSVKGSAGYVAMEKVNGALQGRKGTFALQHSGTMNRGAQSLTLTVVPDTGTGDLAGLSGSMKIVITDGKHFYDFDYTISTG